MMVLPINEAVLSWRHHSAVLWWLGLLYRRPKQLQQALLEFSWTRVVSVGLALYIYVLLYMATAILIAHLIIFTLGLVYIGTNYNIHSSIDIIYNFIFFGVSTVF